MVVMNDRFASSGCAKARKMFRHALVFLTISRAIGTAAENLTYQHEDPDTGEILTCDFCPPGTHMSAHCSSTRPTVCKPCPDNHFTQYPNYLAKCLYCSTFCTENQIVKEECSAFNNRVCECKEGFYWREGYCVKHSECAPGYRVERNGTADRNTECERCPQGTYSEGGRSRAHCQKHTDCVSSGLLVALKGNFWHDNLCASCSEPKNMGGTALLKTILPDFFSHQKLQLNKLKRFVRNHLQGEHQKSSEGTMSHSALRQLLLDRIREWTGMVEKEQLKKLPAALRRSHLCNAADELDRMMEELEKNSALCDLDV